MSMRLDPLKCRQCNTKVGNINSICCSVWHHLKCSGLKKEEFSKHTKNNNLQWVCPKCTVYRCASCVKVIGNMQNSILCNLCKNWVHRNCPLLGKFEFEKIRTKWGTMVLLRMLESKSSISYYGHTKIQQTIWNNKNSKKQR